MKTRKLDFEHNYKKSYFKILKNSNGYIHYPLIDVLVTNAKTGESAPETEEFCIDTGASITILGPKSKKLFDKEKPIDFTLIKYGGNETSLPVYEVKLLIKGEEFEIKAAYDSNLKICSLLGHFSFFQHFDHLAFNINKQICKFIKKY